MDEKRKSRQRTTTSESRRYFGEKINGSSSVSSHRKKKLHGRKSIGYGEELIKSSPAREKDPEADGNVAEDVLQSGKRTGEYVTGSAGKAVQKRRIKKQMVLTANQKQAKEATKGASGLSGKILNGVDDVMGKIGEDAGKFVAENPIPFVCGIVLGILLIVVAASLSSCTMMIGSFQGSAVTTTYTAEDREILAADDYYADLERQLKNRVDQIETDHPGYDEYVYTTDDIKHDPYQLASVLTVLYEDYTENEVVGTMIGIFDEQYELSLTEAEETRTKTETKTRWELKSRTEERQGTRLKWNESKQKYELEVYTYEVEVEYWEEVEYEEETEYQYYILQVRLINHSIDAVVRNLNLTADQLERYELLTAMKGNKSYLF